MNKMTTRILIAASMCLSLATFNGVSASAQGKMKDKPMKAQKSMKMDKTMMKHDDEMMMGEDHAMGMMMEGESAASMMSSYPNSAPGNLTVCTYAEACAMMSGEKKMMMHGDKMMMHDDGMMMSDDKMKMMHDDGMMMSDTGISHHGYPYAAPGNMSSMSYSAMVTMMSDDKMMMHDDKMMGDTKMDKPMKMKKEKMMKKM